MAITECESPNTVPVNDAVFVLIPNSESVDAPVNTYTAAALTSQIPAVMLMLVTFNSVLFVTLTLVTPDLICSPIVPAAGAVDNGLPFVPRKFIVVVLMVLVFG